ncbi:MAG: RHS repeat-associated core domain-containing protein [Bacteroidia bacterium]|nr:RHS repeat-associated core domain-containing protein [Bacteroidia bacterium]
MYKPTGAVSDRYEYEAFGTVLRQTGTTYRYTGQQYDAATGLYSLRARWYDGGTGRFLTRDTYPLDVQNPVELNRYGYTANNPVNGTDPSGLNVITYGQTTDKITGKPRKQPAYQVGVEHPKFLTYKRIGSARAREARWITDRMRKGIQSDPNIRSGSVKNITVAITRVQGKRVMAVNDSNPALIRLLKRQNPGYEVLHPKHDVFGRHLGGGAAHAEQLLVRYGQIQNGTRDFAVVGRDLKAIGVGNTRGPCLEYCQPFFNNVVGNYLPLYWVGPVARSLWPLIVTGFGISGINENSVRVY